LNKRALITGFPGWLTEHLFRRLDELAATSTPPFWAEQLNSVRWRALVAPDGSRHKVLDGQNGRIDDIVEGDIRDPEAVADAMQGVDLVLHAAGIIHPRRIRDLYEINRDGCRCLVSAAVQAGVRRFVFISSNAAAGFARPDQAMQESDEPTPTSHYGRSKLEGEQRMWDALQGSETEGVVLRPTTFYGPHFPQRHIKAYRLAASGRPLVIGDGRNRVSMIYIDDLVDALGRALTVAEASGATAFVADQDSYEWQEIFVAMGQAQGKTVRPLRLPGAIASLCATGDAMLSALGRYSMMVHVAGEARQHMACDITTARTLLGFSPEVGLYEGMRRAVSWARTAGRL
jgi:nucleoside-diphosphate-sugar epimerase